MRSPRLLAVVLLLLLPGAAAQEVDADADVRVDLYRMVNANHMTMDDPCGGNLRPDADGRGFRYEEGDGGENPLDPGQTSSGCGFARIGLRLPEGATEVRPRFFADRTVEALRPGGESRQGVRMMDLVTGQTVFDREYYASTDGSREDRLHAPGPVALPEGLRDVSLEFYFTDVPAAEDGVPAGGALSGRSFSAYVHDVEVEVRGSFGAATVATSQEREGTLLLDVVDATVEVPAFAGFDAVPRVRAGPGFDFHSLRLPDGSRVTEARSYNGSLATGPVVLVERGADAVEVTVSPALVAEAGPGTYRLVVQQTQDARISPALLPVAALLLAAPLPFAVLALYQASVFHREAFGAYRRAARFLMLSVVGASAYYVTVVVGALLGGRLNLMAVVPLPLEAVLLYAQGVAAVLAFAVLWMAARSLYWITRPRPGTRRPSNGRRPRRPPREDPDAT